MTVPHSTDGVFYFEFTDDLGAIFLDLFKKLPLGGNNLFQGFLQIRFRRRRIQPSRRGKDR